MNKKQTAELHACRNESIARLTATFKEGMGKRIAATRKLFGKRIYLADPHSHSIFSDGQSTIAENCERAKLVGLDKLFASDHNTIKQKPAVMKHSNGSWAQESAAGGYHVGLLNPKKVHPWREGESLADGVTRARSVAPFAWVAHPCGFSPVSPKWFKKIVGDLATVDDLAMEVLNGFDVTFRSYYRTGEWGAQVMDALLQAGKKVTPIGSSDAHFLVEIGNSWTGVHAERGAASSIIKTMAAGHCFASEAPFLELKSGSKLMGSTLKPRKGTAVKFSFRVADSMGLAWVRVISGGKVVKEVHAKGEKVVAGTFTRKATGRDAYVRLEVAAIDDRRAFSAPIYLR